MSKKVTINADGIYYRQLNEQIREAVRDGAKEIKLTNVRGQRYIGGALEGDLKFHIEGVPGQDMASFMKGPFIRVEGNAQDGVGNTMDGGEIAINGIAGDVVGYSMRGGDIFIKGDVGYRVGIHMKAYKDKYPVLVIGGKSGDFLGEYMAGGAIILLGMFTDKPEAPITGRLMGTGMHGGVMYVRGKVPAEQLWEHLLEEDLDDKDQAFVKGYVERFAKHFKLDKADILSVPFRKFRPRSHRPYGNLYVPC